jgi:hypothetical protein
MEGAKNMKTRLLVLLLLAGSAMFAATRVVVGIGVGGHGYYAARPPVVAYAPPCPGPGYFWVPGYLDRVGPRSLWHAGYWTLRPNVGGYRVGPRTYGHYDHGYRHDRYDHGYRRR